MRLTFVFAALILFIATGGAPAQEKRSWFGRVLHPFGSTEKIPEYRNPKIRGLVLTVDLPSEPVKLTEMRQLPVHILLINRGDHAVELDFPTEQRIEILLHDSTGRVVTRWSENRAFEEQPGTLLINPNEHVEYLRDDRDSRAYSRQGFHRGGGAAGLSGARHETQVDDHAVMGIRESRFGRTRSRRFTNLESRSR